MQKRVNAELESLQTSIEARRRRREGRERLNEGLRVSVLLADLCSFYNIEILRCSSF